MKQQKKKNEWTKSNQTQSWIFFLEPRILFFPRGSPRLFSLFLDIHLHLEPATTNFILLLLSNTILFAKP